MSRMIRGLVLGGLVLGLGLGSIGCSESSSPPKEGAGKVDPEKMKAKMMESRKDRGATGPAGEPEKDKDKAKAKDKGE